jgi:predicted metal-dependent enzyme (double-stranded beta helix superfamily)
LNSPLSRLASRCQQCLAAGGRAEEVRALVTEALSELASGPPQEAIDDIVHRTDDLLVVGLAQPPYANTPIHNHGGIWCVIGMAVGREENALHAESAGDLGEVDRFVVAAGEAVVLGPNAIHKIRNPDGVMSLGVHVYGADLLSATRYMWDPRTGEKSLLNRSKFDAWCDELIAAATASAEVRARW